MSAPAEAKLKLLDIDPEGVGVSALGVLHGLVFVRAVARPLPHWTSGTWAAQWLNEERVADS